MDALIGRIERHRRENLTAWLVGGFVVAALALVDVAETDQHANSGTVEIMFDVDEWWGGLSDQGRELAIRHRDDDPLHPEVVRQLDAEGVIWADTGGARWYWTSEVRDFLAGGCE